MLIRNLLQPGRARTPTRAAFVASIPVYVRRTVIIFFLIPSALPMGVLAVAGHFSFQGMTQVLFTAMANSGTDPNTIRVRDCPPLRADNGPIAHQCDHAPMKDVPIAVAAEQNAPQIEWLYAMVVMTAIALYFGSSPSPFDARGRCEAWVRRLIGRMKQGR